MIKKKTSDTGLPIVLGLVMAKYAALVLEGPWQGREKDNLVSKPRTQGSRVKYPKNIWRRLPPGKARGGNI